MKDINLNSDMKLYICTNCSLVHTKGSKIQKLHSKYRKKNLVKKYFCSLCEVFHNKNTIIHLKHYNYRNKQELDSNELYVISFKKAWSRQSNSEFQKKIEKTKEYVNPNKKIIKKNQLNQKFENFHEIFKSNLNLDFSNFLNNVSLFLEMSIDFPLIFSKFSELERKFKEIYKTTHISKFGKYELIKNYLDGLYV